MRGRQPNVPEARKPVDPARSSGRALTSHNEDNRWLRSRSSSPIPYHADTSPGLVPSRLDPGRGRRVVLRNSCVKGDGRHRRGPCGLDGALESRDDGRLQQPNQVSQTDAIWSIPF